MPSVDARTLGRHALRLAAAWAVLAALPGAAQPQAPRQQVQEATAALREEIAPGPPLRQHTLRFRQREKAEPDKPADTPAPPRREGAGSASLLDGLARYGVWILGIVLVALVLVRLRRWVRERADALFTAPPPALPSHVHSLDVRPESLPATVGAAAAGLWQQGEPRAALALLYRGALSRLIHAHGVPVHGASTEGECLALAEGRLDADRHALFGRLVGAWQQAVYAARLPAADAVLALCRDFDRLLGASASTAPDAEAAP